jgi:uncharacterized protein (TIGR02270 family)
MQSAILPHIVSQHAEDASFLWLQRQEAVRAPHFDLLELATLDGRVEAHLDGLRIAGGAGWEICSEVAAEEGVAGAFTLGVLAFESGSKERVYGLLERMSDAPDIGAGLAAALGWMPPSHAQRYIKFLLSADTVAWRHIGIAAGAAHRELTDTAIGAALNDPDALLRALACRAAGELGRRELLGQVRQQGRTEHETCRFYAAWSAALLGDKAPVAFLRATAESASQYAEMAMHMVVRVSELSPARAWFRQLSALPNKLRLAIKAAGAIGAPEEVPWLIDLMHDPQLARLAAESFTMITGADLDRQYLKGEQPEDFESGPSDNPEDDDVEMDPDEDLPWPKITAVQDWWLEHRREFRSGTRYLLGRAISAAALQQILREGRQRQRAAAALDLALHTPGALFEVRAPGFRQLAQLGR